jgi:hypothetical protein
MIFQQQDTFCNPILFDPFNEGRLHALSLPKLPAIPEDGFSHGVGSVVKGKKLNEFLEMKPPGGPAFTEFQKSGLCLIKGMGEFVQPGEPT